MEDGGESLSSIWDGFLAGSGILETSAALHNIKRDSVGMAAGGSTQREREHSVSQRTKTTTRTMMVQIEKKKKKPKKIWV